jgi:hypothetical protein
MPRLPPVTSATGRTAAVAAAAGRRALLAAGGLSLLAAGRPLLAAPAWELEEVKARAEATDGRGAPRSLARHDDCTGC